MHPHPARLGRELVEQPAVGNAHFVIHVRGQDRVVLIGKDFGQPGDEGRVGAVEGCEVGRARAEVTRRAHRDDRGCQPLRDRPEYALFVRAATVDLVDEHQGRDAQPL